MLEVDWIKAFIISRLTETLIYTSSDGRIIICKKHLHIFFYVLLIIKEKMELT